MKKDLKYFEAREIKNPQRILGGIIELNFEEEEDNFGNNGINRPKGGQNSGGGTGHNDRPKGGS